MNNRFCNFFRSFCPRRGVGDDNLRQPFLNRVAINGPLQEDEEKIPPQIEEKKPVRKEPERLLKKRRALIKLEESISFVENPFYCQKTLAAGVLWPAWLSLNAAMVYLFFASLKFYNQGDEAYKNYNAALIPGSNHTCSSLGFKLPDFSDLLWLSCADDSFQSVRDFVKNQSNPIFCIDNINKTCAASPWTVVGIMDVMTGSFISAILLIRLAKLTAKFWRNDREPSNLAIFQLQRLSKAAEIAGFVIANKSFLEIKDLLEAAHRKLQRSIEHDIYFKRVLIEDELKEVLVSDVLPVIFEYANLNEADELQAIRVDDLEPDEEKYSAAAPGMRI